MKTTIEMALEAGIDDWWDSGSEWREKFNEHLKVFEALVRADERGNQRQPLTLNEMTAIEEKVYMQTTHKGKPLFEYAQALIRAIEAAHNIGAKP